MNLIPKIRKRLAAMSSVEFLPERVSLLYRLSGTDVPIILGAAGITAFALWGYVSARLIFAWFVWLGLASTARYLMARAYHDAQPPAADAAKWENYFCVVSATLGASWGVALLFIYDKPSSLQEITITFLISSIAMGLPPSLAPSPKAFASFILPVLAPVIAMLFSYGGGLNASTGLLMLVFASVLLGLYLSNHNALMQILGYGHENTVLLEKVRAAETSLTSALTEQQQIFDTAAIGLAFVSQRSVVKCNRQFAAMFGYTREELAGSPTRIGYLSGEDFIEAGEHAYAKLAKGENYSDERQFRRKDGSLFWAFAEISGIDRSNPEAGIIIAMSDITARKLAEAELQKAKERLDLAVQSSAVTVWEWDARRGSIYLDAAWSSMTGGAAKESFVPAEEIKKIVHPDDLAGLQLALGECLKGLRTEYMAEHRVRKSGSGSDGNWVWILSRGRVVERAGDGRALRMAGTNVDITQRKRAEVELLTALLREKELTELKSKFVSMASHEFRTPLATILSAAELLEHYPDSLSAEDKLKILHGIQNGAKRMNLLIEDVLVIGKAEAGALQFRPGPVDLKDLCRKVAEEFRIGEGKKHLIQFEHRFEHGNMSLDERLLRHILTNLLSNALKYSPTGSTVSFLLTERDGQALIEVGDQGIGIPPQDQVHLFESFHRASNVGNRQGTGLGLAIVKRAVELHGGTISVDSQVGAGTRIRVLLPLAAETTRQAA